METLITLALFILGLLTLHGFANKFFLPCGKAIIPLRILLSILFYSAAISLCIYNKNIMFGTGWGLNLLTISPIGITFAFLLSYRSKKQYILKNWWKNIVYATISAFSIWLFTREPQGKNGIILMFIPLIALSITILHFSILLVQSFIHKHFKESLYCLVSYFILTIVYFSFAGYRNYTRNYTLQESIDAQSYLWEYEVHHTNKNIPDSLKLQIKEAYAEKEFHYKYNSWFSYTPTIRTSHPFYINIVFNKRFFVKNEPNFILYYRYHNMIRCKYDTIPPADSIYLPFTYFLTPDSKIVTDTLLLTKKLNP